MDEASQGAAAGAAALTICESILIALVDLKIIADKEAHAILVDAAETHRRAIPDSQDAVTHRAVAALIDRITTTTPVTAPLSVPFQVRSACRGASAARLSIVVY